MRKDIRDEVATLVFQLHELFNGHQRLRLLKCDLIDDQFLKSRLIAIASLERKRVELVVDLSRVIDFKDFFGAADYFFEFKSCGAKLLNYAASAD